MKGRKPKYSQEETNEIVARLAAGESPSALSTEFNRPRTSILRCADSARAPGQITEQAKRTIKDKKATQRERLFWRFVEANLRQGIQKATQAAPKEVAAMLESAVKLKALMTTSVTGSRGSLIQFTDETILRFGRFIKGEVVPIASVEQGQEANLGEGKADALETDPGEGTSVPPEGTNGE
ncbi:MAG: hypothetical protein NTX59_10300 [Elusimicrobia bacterium]|nr:hypothetical protein [Elusimicrobiota bacterium]